MSNDATILTAAREVSAAAWAVKVADERKLAADRAVTEAARVADVARSRLKHAERRLLELSSQKSAEPAPQPAPQPVSPVTALPPVQLAAVPTIQAPRRRVGA